MLKDILKDTGDIPVEAGQKIVRVDMYADPKLAKFNLDNRVTYLFVYVEEQSVLKLVIIKATFNKSTAKTEFEQLYEAETMNNILKLDPYEY